MPKIKQKKNKAVGRQFKVLISFEWPRRLLPKNKVGILVMGETFTITKQYQFTEVQLNRLLHKGYLKKLKGRKKT